MAIFSNNFSLWFFLNIFMMNEGNKCLPTLSKSCPLTGGGKKLRAPCADFYFGLPPPRGRTKGFWQGGREGQNNNLRTARAICLPPPPVRGQRFNRGGQTFVTFIHHDMVTSIIYNIQCILSFCLLKQWVPIYIWELRDDI